MPFSITHPAESYYMQIKNSPARFMHCVRVYDAVAVVRFYLYLTYAVDMTDEDMAGFTRSQTT